MRRQREAGAWWRCRAATGTPYTCDLTTVQVPLFAVYGSRRAGASVRLLSIRMEGMATADSSDADPCVLLCLLHKAQHAAVTPMEVLAQVRLDSTRGEPTLALCETYDPLGGILPAATAGNLGCRSLNLENSALPGHRLGSVLWTFGRRGLWLRSPNHGVTVQFERTSGLSSIAGVSFEVEWEELHPC